ncbi:hypothetical protein BV898_06017 [Hypsibius exemplaris]|uniref:Uncharacterized protein n=1 Tax=Hypsibius exemplaris TaxID=2072580 RepID=A0A1W0WXW6_HYPEX|nr:hypothetical protein BV898_06017 [Hypsibius exemplaris]
MEYEKKFGEHLEGYLLMSKENEKKFVKRFVVLNINTYTLTCYPNRPPSPVYSTIREFDSSKGGFEKNLEVDDVLKNYGVQTSDDAKGVALSESQSSGPSKTISLENCIGVSCPGNHVPFMLRFAKDKPGEALVFAAPKKMHFSCWRLLLYDAVPTGKFGTLMSYFQRKGKSSKMTIYNAIVAPHSVTFMADQYTQKAQWLRVKIMILFLVSFILTFRTKHENNKGVVVFYPSEIAECYLNPLFLVDVLTAIPFDLLYIVSQQHNCRKII